MNYRSMNYLVSFIAIAALSGCGPIYYVPNTQNVPVIKNKGQINISVGLNASEDTDGFEFQGAYGLTDNIALQFNTDFVNSSEEGSGNFVELGGGYYKNLSEKFVFETYGLIGIGSMNYKSVVNYNEVINGYEEIDANFFRFGVQPSISFSSKYFIASLSGRFANINYYNIGGNINYEIDYLNENSSYWLAEPALTLQAGAKNIKLQLQFQLSYNLTEPDFSQNYSLVSLGLKYDINPKTD